MIVCLEGIDNVGKTTMLKKLKDFYKDECLILNTESIKELDLKVDTVENFYYYKNLKSLFFIISAEQEEHFQRNVLLLKYARQHESKYKVIFLDRCFLSFAYYNIRGGGNHRMLLKDYALSNYINIILYFPNKVELKQDEELDRGFLEDINESYKYINGAYKIPKTDIEQNYKQIQDIIKLEQQKQELYDFRRPLYG